jgi:hypothetical protein
MRKFVGGMAAVILGAGMALAGAGVANAGEAEPTQDVWWLVPATVTTLPQGNTPEIWPQSHLPGGLADMECGQFAQVDSYPESEVAGVTADKELVDGDDHDFVKRWYFVGIKCGTPVDVGAPECDATTIDTTTDRFIETSEFGYANGGGDEVHAPKPESIEPIAATRPLDADEQIETQSADDAAPCYKKPAPEPTPTPTTIPTETIAKADELAYTGSNETAGLIAAGLLFAAGLVMVLVRNFSTRKAV